MINVKNVTKKFGDVVAVNHVSFEISRGEVVGFLGPNGAGKSTTMRMITGFLTPTSGQILIEGVDVATSPVSTRKKIGYLPESAAIYTEMEVTDYLKFMAEMRGLKGDEFKKRLRYVVEKCQLKSVLGRKIGNLSKGYRQRVGLAQALLHDPDILILDEPTVGLDPNQIMEIRTLIKEIAQNKTIFLSTHILSEVSANCGRVIIINNGKTVLQGKPEDLMVSSGKKTTYRVSVRGDLAGIKREFTNMPDYLNMDVTQMGGDLYHVALDCVSGKDQSEEIFERVVKNNWRLSLLMKEKQTLEDVFKNITQ